MIKYSHVRLYILSDRGGVDEISQKLDVGPSGLVFDPDAKPPPTGLTHHWFLNSPMGAEGDPTARLAALLDLIEPFGNALLGLDDRYPRWIDIVYHITPQHVGGITGEFDWFRCPASLMAKMSQWNLNLSYETFWFDHPEWKRIRLPWWRRILPSFRRGA
jgi:hypothetical protein